MIVPDICMVGGLLVIKQGYPKGHRINDFMIYEPPDRQFFDDFLFAKNLIINTNDKIDKKIKKHKLIA